MGMSIKFLSSRAFFQFLKPALRRLKLWTCASMKEERLSGLVMHRGTEYIPTTEEVYSRKSNWRQFKN